MCVGCSVYSCKQTEYSQCEMGGFEESNAGACVQTPGAMEYCIDSSTGAIAVSFHTTMSLASLLQEPTCGSAYRKLPKLHVITFCSSQTAAK